MKQFLTGLILFIFLCLPVASTIINPYSIIDLESTDQTQFSQSMSHWTVTNAISSQLVSTCGDVLLGGYGILNYNAEFMGRYDNLATHNSVFIRFKVWLIDPVLNDKLNVYVYGQGTTLVASFPTILQSTNPSIYAGSTCGDPTKGDAGSGFIVLQVQHSDSSLGIRVQQLLSSSPPSYIGIREVGIALSMNSVATNKGYVQYLVGTATSNLCNSATQYIISGSTCGNCVSPCQSCYGGTASNCITCNSGYQYNGVNCLQCYSTCLVCSGTAANQCISCQTGLLLFPDSTCQAAPCPSGYFSDGVSCNQCHNTCALCSGPSATGCITCQANLLMLPDSSCVSPCPNGYYATTTHCMPCDSTCATCTGPSATDCILCKTIQNAKAFYHTDTHTCDGTCAFPSSQVELQYQKLCQPSNSPQLLLLASETRDVSSRGFTFGAVVTTILTSGSAGMLSVGMFSEMFYYVKFIKVSHSADLELCLENWNTDFINLGFQVNLPDFINDKMENYPVPDILAKYGVISNFFLNFWQSIGIWAITIILIIILGVLEWQTDRSSKKLLLFFQRLRISFQSLLLSMFYDTISDIAFYSILEFKSNTHISDYRIVSFALAGFCVMLLAIVLIMHLVVLCKRFKLQKNKSKEKEAFSKKYESIQVLFKDFKEESFSQQGFLLFYIIRGTLFKIALATLFEYPFVQIILIVALSCIMIVYLLMIRPFEDLIDGIQILFCEASLLVVNVVLLITAISDRTDSEAKLDTLGLIIITLAMICNFEVLVYTAIKFLLAVKGFVQSCRKRNKSKPVDLSLQGPSFSLGTDLPTVHRFGPPEPRIPNDIKYLMQQSRRKIERTSEIQTEASILRINTSMIQPNNDSVLCSFDESPLNLSSSQNTASLGLVQRNMLNRNEVATKPKRRRRE